MLTVNRSRTFWSSIVEHPSVGTSLGMTTEGFLNCVRNERVTPLASENGGWLIINLGVGKIVEFHGVFTDKGRGKESFQTGCELARLIFTDHDMAVTYETDNPNSRPPLSFGFQKENDLWFLTKSRWESSPVYRRTIKCLQQY